MIRIAGVRLSLFCLFFFHLVQPDVHNLLQLARSEVTESCFLPILQGPRELLVVGEIAASEQLPCELESFAQLLSKAEELLRLGKGAKDDEDFLPFSQIGVLDDIAQIVRHD
jgi:hypothetical protein